MMRLWPCEAKLLSAIRELKYGELFPDEMVPDGKQKAADLTPQQHQLIVYCRELGTPTVVKIVEGQPALATFEVPTEAGRGLTHRKLV